MRERVLRREQVLDVPVEEAFEFFSRAENLEAITPVGSYAVQLRWNDGHDSGIYTWDYLYEACLD